ncbi:hypothetical protein [Acidocella sp.]|uniref:hypothetical protein n=1 Tax=Acidocella sp. TaxID=50710 RepID=UPI0017A15BB4|nr:hypothetical protein [Acidocella sp.]NNM57781.1 hypothetical protein [Acidocella sp.]
MTSIETTALNRLEQEHRLLNAVLKAPTTKPGRFGFRGDIALKFQQQLADEKRPPEYSIEQVFIIASEDNSPLPFLAGYLHSFAYLADAAKVLSGLLSPTGTYFMFCNNIDLLAKYRVKMGNITFNILPLDESTVWMELMELIGLDKTDMKKLSTGGKLDQLADKAISFVSDYQEKSFEEVLKLTTPVRNRNENRPV